MWHTNCANIGMTQYFDPKWLNALISPDSFWLYLIPLSFSLILNFAGRMPSKKQTLATQSTVSFMFIPWLVIGIAFGGIVALTALLAIDKTFSTSYFNYFFNFFI